jgi:hypothetical protein
MVTLLIPAAGFGQRIGSPPAKELLIRPNTNKAFIDWPLDLALEKNWRAVVISREDKTQLNDYIDNYISNHKTKICNQTREAETAIKTSIATITETTIATAVETSHVELVKIVTSKDWYDTLLQSKAYWSERNIVFLPDVDFGPVEILTQLSLALKNSEIAVATHFVNDPENWGHIYASNNNIEVSEKPKNYPLPAKQAWGIFGFQKNAGTAILKAQWQSQLEQKPQRLNKTCAFFPLDFFCDLTRTSITTD